MATVETLEKLERRITISLPRDEVQTEVDKQLKIRARTAKAPGFRPGKVPLKMVAAQYEPEIRANVLNNKIHEVFSATASANALRVAGFPRIEAKTDDVPESHVAFHAIFEVYPEVTLGDMSQLEIEKVKTEITEAEVDNTLNVLRKRQAHFHVRGEQGPHGDGGPDKSAQNGDRVTIDFTGTLDGVEFDGGKAEDFTFVLGEGQMLAEFEAATLGMSVGESKQFPLTFPENYHGKDVAGKIAEFTVTLEKVEWAHMPEIDADFVKSMGIEAGEVSALRAEIRDNLVRESDVRIKSTNKDNVMEALEKLAQFDLPKALVDQEIENLMEMTRQNMAQRGQDMSKVNIPPAIFTGQAERRVRLGLILADLVKLHDLNATPEQVRTQVEALAKSYQDPQMVINYYYGNKERMDEVGSMVLEENVMNYVLTQAKVTEKAIPFNELMGQTAAA